MLKKNYNIFFVLLITGLVHAASEMLVGLMSLPFVTVANGNVLKYILVTIGAGTFNHHCIDFVISFVIFNALKASKLLGGNINYKSFKA